MPKFFTHRATPALMNEAADRLTQYFQLLAKDAAIGGRSTAAPSENCAAKGLIQQAQQALIDSPEFQRLLSEAAPEPLRQRAQQWLIRRLHHAENICNNSEQMVLWVKQQLDQIVVSIQQDEVLRELIQQIQGLPHDSRDRRNLIQTLLIEIQCSKSLTRHLPSLPEELYNDALHDTMLWFCDHLNDYDPTQSGPMTWFNRNLYYQAMKILRSRHRPLPLQFVSTEQGKLHQGGPDAYSILIIEAEYQILDDLYDWIQQDNTGNLKRTSLTDRLDLNVQTVTKAVLDRIRVLRSLRRAASQPYTSTATESYDLCLEQPTSLSQLFEYLSAQLEYPPDKLRRFWRDKCRPCIEDFLQQSGNC